MATRSQSAAERPYPHAPELPEWSGRQTELDDLVSVLDRALARKAGKGASDGDR